jgi:hypothetical protein
MFQRNPFLRGALSSIKDPAVLARAAEQAAPLKFNPPDDQIEYVRTSKTRAPGLPCSIMAISWSAAIV